MTSLIGRRGLAAAWMLAALALSACGGPAVPCNSYGNQPYDLAHLPCR